MADWKSNLDDFFEKKDANDAEIACELAQRKAELPVFFSTVVVPALNELKEQLEKRNRKVTVNGGDESASIRVELNNRLELDYRIEINLWPSHANPYVVTMTREAGQTFRGVSAINRGTDDSTQNITKEDIAEDFLRLYKGQIGR